ncbi:TPA: hypothetical protein ACGO62_002018 [Streptococcus suis]
MADLIWTDLGSFTPEDYEKLVKWAEEMTLQKQKVLGELDDNTVPHRFRNDWFDVATSYEDYLQGKIQFSPRDLEIIETYNRSSAMYGDGLFQAPLKSEVSTSEEWFTAIYDTLRKSHDENDVMQQFLIDATILISRYESATLWLQRIRETKDKNKKKGNWVLPIMALSILVMFKIIPEISYYSIVDYLKVLIIPSVPLGVWLYLQKNKFSNQKIIHQQLEMAQEVADWSLRKANEHPLIQQQGNESSSLFFGMLYHYYRQGRVNSLREAINLVYQERQYTQLSQQQEMIEQEVRFAKNLAIATSLYSIIKK